MFKIEIFKIEKHETKLIYLRSSFYLFFSHSSPSISLFLVNDTMLIYD